MYISDEFFKKMLAHFNLPTAEENRFIEDYRQQQVSVFFIAFFTYYELTKTKLETDYLQTITREARTAADFKNMADLMHAELQHNPVAMKFIKDKMDDYHTGTLREMLSALPAERQIEAFKELFSEYNLMSEALNLPSLDKIMEDVKVELSRQGLLTPNLQSDTQ